MEDPDDDESRYFIPVLHLSMGGSSPDSLRIDPTISAGARAPRHVIVTTASLDRMNTPTTAPRLPHAHVPRPGLIRLLEDSADTAIRFVTAPAGYGKTTLLTEWVRSRSPNETAVWLGVDEANDHEDTFWAALHAGMTRVLPRGAEKDASRADVADARTAVTQLTASLQRQLTIVIDRFDDLADEDIAEQLFSWAASTDHVGLVLAVRAMPAASLLTRFGGGSVLTATDLAFRPEETERLAAALHASVPGSAVASLTAAAEGWPLAIRIALQHAAVTGAAHAWRDTTDTVAEAQRAIIGDLARRPEFSYLVLTSVADTVTPDLATALGAQPAQAGILDDAARQGLGWWEAHDDGPVFRVHPVIRRALIERLSADQRRSALGALAGWHAQHDRYGAAFGAAVEAERWDLAQALAYAAFPDVSGYLSTRQDLIPKVPISVTRADPMLGFLTGLSHYTRGHNARAVGTIGTAFATVQRRRLRSHGAVTPEQVWTQGLLTVGLRLSGRYEFVETALRRFKTMLAEVVDPDGLLIPAIELFQNETAVTELYLDHLEDAAAAIRSRPLRSEKTKKQHFYGDALEACILVQRGDLVTAREHVATLMSQPLPPGFMDNFYAIPLHLAAASLHLEEGAPEAAAVALAHTEAHWPTNENWPLLLIAHVNATWFRTDALTALETFELRHAEQHRRARISPAMTARLRAKKAELLIAAGRPRQARALVAAHAKHPRLAALRALGLLAEGLLADAAAATEQTLAIPGLGARDRVDLHVVAALAALRSGNPETAGRQFRHAVGIALRFGLRTPFTRMPVAERTLLLDAIEADAAERELVLALAALFPAAAAIPRLTKRELIALRDLSRGTSLQRAAEVHQVSVNTVKTQRRSLYRKLGVSTASEALRRARELEIL